MPGVLSPFVMLLLVAVTALGPVAMQIFLPALPAIQEGLSVSFGTAQLTLSLSALSIALATLAYGPLADRLGRRPVLLAGIVIYLGGSLMCTLAPEIWTLVIGRIIQAAGGAGGMVLARTMIRDLFEREQAAQAIAYLTMAMVAAPMMAPALGGVLTDQLGWRAVFAASGVVGLLVLLGSVARLPETRHALDAALSIRAMFRGFTRLLRSAAFRAYAFQGAFSISLFFCFLAGAPYIMVRVLQRPATEYGLLFMLVSGGFMLGNLIAARLSARVGIDRMILLGTGLALTGTVLALALAVALPWSALTLFLPVSLVAFAQGISIPNSVAGAISVDPQAAGSASGLSGFLQMAMAALAAQIVGMIQNGTPYPTLIAMLLCATGALLAILSPRLAAAASRG
ncbi:MAG TPA: multidrug effflux MFS transporter [Geminicoccaceae bacterium]|nr:multidrug effflux MFS transporter [Geminicoccaceae bacterium]